MAMQETRSVLRMAARQLTEDEIDSVGGAGCHFTGGTTYSTRPDNQQGFPTTDYDVGGGLDC